MAAEKEYGLEKALAAMKDEWATLEFEVRPYKETGTYLVSGVDEIITLLDDHIVKTQTMRGSPYILPIEVECKVWYVLQSPSPCIRKVFTSPRARDLDEPQAVTMTAL